MSEKQQPNPAENAHEGHDGPQFVENGYNGPPPSPRADMRPVSPPPPPPKDKGNSQ
ncbi:hypothetical protein Pan241w_26150 [Gimesia alba]|uniref:Uncharacterized protein n=1 Tax=Gimesia alba TaxID=2527973 RepID=A0A517RF98_9PLAN|nr:hypothetical protein Pan241w_26150 [Gimesia alba]